MRDAFGGTFMIKLFLVFIAIYIGFTAIALNYAKAFKVKNKIIEYLESSEISNLASVTSDQKEAIDEFVNAEILEKMKYNVENLNKCASASGDEFIQIRSSENEVIALCHPAGIYIEDIQANRLEQQRNSGNVLDENNSGIKKGNTEGIYYRVSTYVGWSLPFLNGLLSLNGNNQQREVPIGVWEISGETRLIVNE